MPLPMGTRYTLADLLAWDGPERMELHGGTPVMMAPPSRVHQELVGELFGQLREYLKDRPCKVYVAPFAVRLFQGEKDPPETVDTMVEPDIAVICDPRKLDDMGCKGAPDLVVEVVSPSTARYDRFTKYNLYERAGVREYWIVDPAAGAVQMFVLEEGRFANAAWVRFGEELPVRLWEDCVLRLPEELAGAPLE